MDRRLLTFVIASTAFFLIYSILRVNFVPEVPEPPVAVAETAPEDGTAGENDPTSPSSEADGGDAVDDSANDNAASSDRPARPNWVTLGSMDPDSGYNMLVTLNSRGAGIERIELTQRNEKGNLRYRRVDTLSGYLGYFAGLPAQKMDGVEVNVVGPGTPADLATAKGVNGGIKPGDVIIAVAGKPVTNSAEIREVLSDIKPGQNISVEVERPTATRPEEENSEEENSTTTATQSIIFDATLTDHPLDLVRLSKTGGDDEIAGNLNRLSSLVTLGKVNRKNIRKGQRTLGGIPDTTGLNWTVVTEGAEQGSENGDGPAVTASVEFEVTLTDREMDAIGGQAVALKRSFSLPKNSYVLDTSVDVTNKGDKPQELAYRLEGFNGITLEGWWYSNKISPNWGGSAARDVIYNTTAEDHALVSGYALLKRARNTPEDADQNLFAEDQSEDSRNLKYIGIDAQYFDVAYLPANGEASMQGFRRATADIVADPSLIEKHKDKAVNTSFYLDSKVETLAAGESIRQDLQIFAGPKTTELLEQHGLSDALYYGWFSFIAKPLGNLLHGLFWLVKNYALAIILLTVLVRGLMFPLSRKAAINAQRMQELAPELKKIGEKYKDDMEGRLKAQRALQQRVGFNPMAGCLPMFLQLPIFVGLYRSLSVDIELRQAAFSQSLDWASNLSSPDQFMFWGDWLWGYLSGRGNGWLGPYLNVLPLVVMVLFLVQQKLFMPPATDEQTAMTQKMMSWMTLVMGLFFFRVPAGLCLYFVTSSLWGICERILVKKTLPKGKHFDEAMLAGAADGDGVIEGTSHPKTKTIADRLKERMNPPEEPRDRPNKRKRPGGGKKK